MLFAYVVGNKFMHESDNTFRPEEKKRFFRCLLPLQLVAPTPPPPHIRGAAWWPQQTRGRWLHSWRLLTAAPPRHRRTTPTIRAATPRRNELTSAVRSAVTSGTDGSNSSYKTRTDELLPAPPPHRLGVGRSHPQPEPWRREVAG